MNYLDPETTMTVLVKVAEYAARESSAQHPEDIMIAMTFAMENAAKTLTVLGQMKLI